MAQAGQKKAEMQKLEQEEQVGKKVEQAATKNKLDVFEEVRKFKQLLDEGIISEDEFNKKKKGPFEVLPAPFDVKLSDYPLTIVQPDIMIICDKNKLLENTR